MAQHPNNSYNPPIPYGSGFLTSGHVGQNIRGTGMSFVPVPVQQIQVPHLQQWPYQQQYHHRQHHEMQYQHQNIMGPSAFQPHSRGLTPHYRSGEMCAVPAYSTSFPAIPQYAPTPVLQNPYQVQVTRTNGYQASSIAPSVFTGNNGCEYDEDFSEKLIAYARFNRNTDLIKDILSDVMVPDVRHVVTTTRLDTLKTQVKVLEKHTELMQKEIEEMSERYRKKKEDFLASTANFHETYPRECKRKTFTRRSLERIQVKWYHRFKAENPRNWAKYLCEPGPIPMSATLVKSVYHTDFPSVQGKKPIVAKQEPEEADNDLADQTPTTSDGTMTESSFMPQNASIFVPNSQITEEESRDLVNETEGLEIGYTGSHKKIITGKDLLISGSENYLRALLNRGSNSSPSRFNQDSSSTIP